MNEEYISQTVLDQMVGSDYGQMIKAAIPYLSPKGQQILSIYEKSVELMNTISLFGNKRFDPEMSAMSLQAQEPMEIINNIRNFCYGQSREQLDKIVNIMAMFQMIQLMNQPEDRKENPNE